MKWTDLFSFIMSECAEKLVLSFMIPEIERYMSNEGEKDYKTLLQEAHQKKSRKNKSSPLYYARSSTC